MTGRVADKTAIVTGGGAGIGRSVAERLGEEGASVVLADVDAEGAAATAEELRDRGIEAVSCHCDVSDVDDARALADSAVERFGTVDVLVNNAGIASRGTFDELEPDHWNRVIDVNLTGMFNCCHAVVPAIVESGGGRVVNVSSTAGRNISYYGGPDYTAAKWGVIGLTKHLAWELGPEGVTVNAVAPGPTVTERFEDSTSRDARENNARKVPVGRLGEPEDQANAVLYLASDEASYVNGAVLDVNGGLLLSVRNEI